MTRTVRHAFDDGDRAVLDDLAPVLRHAAALDAGALARFRISARTATVFVRLPFRVLVARTIEHAGGSAAGGTDVTVSAHDALAWLDADPAGAPAPELRDVQWRAGLPPEDGWRRLDTVPDDVIRPLVRQGALTLRDAARREGVPGAQPRAEVADALLDSVVLTVTDGADRSAANAAAPVTLRALSALTRMGFLPRGGHAHVDTSGRWIRVAARNGTVYLERPRTGLQLA